MFPLTAPGAPRPGHPQRPTVRSRKPQSGRQPAAEGQLAVALDPGPLFDLARDALVAIDIKSRRIRLWNAAAATLLGYSRGEALGHLIDLLLPPAVARLHQERLAHYARSGDVSILEQRRQCATPVLNRLGLEINVDLIVTPFDLAGAPRMVLFSMREATAQDRGHLSAVDAARGEVHRSAPRAAPGEQVEQLETANRQELEGALRRAERATRRLSRHVAIDPAPSAMVRCLSRIVELRVATVQRIVAESDDLAALEAGTLTLNVERVNLVPLMGRIVAEKRISASQYRFKLSAPQGLTTVGDRTRLEQMLNLLIGQAMRRNPRGCWIDIDLRRPLAGLARIEVRDYGRRLSEGERGQLAGAAHPSRVWRLTKLLVERHGGSLTVEYPIEAGLRAVVTLPTNGTRVSRPM